MDLTQVARFHVAPGYDPADPDSWVWEDRSADVSHVDGGITIRGGRADETSLVGAGSATLQVDNAGGHYCTQNPLGRWYERLAQGCPARWGTISGKAAFATAATNGWGSPDVGGSWVLSGSASDWSVSGGTGQRVMSAANTTASARLVDADARHGDATVTVMSPVVATGAPLLFGIRARYASEDDNLYFSLEFGLSGALKAQIRRRSAGGTLTDLGTTVLGWTYSASQRIRMRCQWDGHRLRMRVWPEADPEPTTWDVLGEDTVCAGSEVLLHCWRFVGNTNTSPVFHFDDVEVEAVEIVGTIEAWPVEWDDTATVSWAGIEITGISERLAVGQEQLLSPIRRQLSGLGIMPQGYWPLEDPAGVTVAASALPGGVAASCIDVDFGSADCPPGASSAAVLRTGGTSMVIGSVRQWTTARDGYAAMAYVRMPTLSADAGSTIGNRIMHLYTTGTITQWVVYATSGGWNVEGYLADGTRTINVGSYAYVFDTTTWLALQLEAEEIGGSVTWRLIWFPVGSPANQIGTGTYSGTADTITKVLLRAPVDGTAVAHLWAGDDDLPFLDATLSAVSAGYAGELAEDRIPRLGLEGGTSIGVEPGDTEPLGAQKPGTFGQGVRSAEAADMGVLFENGAYLGYRPRTARYNRPVWMTWAIASTGGDIAGRPRPVDDNQRVRNRWTVTREDGGEATAQNKAHVDRSGPRPDTATVNVNDPARLLDYASWRVHLGVWPEYRWPTLEVDFTDSPSQLALWRGRPFAPRIKLTGVPSQGPIGADPELIVEGWTQEITSNSWKVTASCSPAKPWDVGVWDSTSSLWDLRSCTTSGSHAAGVTTITLAITDDEAWSTAGGYDLTISGEQIGVPPGGMGARTGSPGAYQQVITGAVRAKNGISKTLPANSSVHVTTPGRWAV